MGMHTDMRPTRAGQIAASRGDVIGVSVGANMLFWYGKSVGAKVAKERHGVLLHDGDTWVWKYEDDMKHKHARPQSATPVHARRVPPRGFGPLDPKPAPPPLTSFPPPFARSRHGVWFPTIKQGRKRDGVRYAFMFRWSNRPPRSFDVDYPHRLQMTDDEKVGVKERQHKAAASVSKRACPPKRTRVATERACK